METPSMLRTPSPFNRMLKPPGLIEQLKKLKQKIKVRHPGLSEKEIIYLLQKKSTNNIKLK